MVLLPLFDDRPRTLAGDRPYRLSAFAYLNTSSSETTGRVRLFLESMLERYPMRRREEVHRRLRSLDDTKHLSTAFELLLHEILIRSGHTIIDVEPPLRHSSRRPDYLVETPSGTRFYLEATLAQGPMTRAIMRKATRYGTLDLPLVLAINALGHPANEAAAVDALFGTPNVQGLRQADGAFTGPRGSFNAQISAVISTEGMTPWTAATQAIRTFRNPLARRALADVSWPGDVFTITDGGMETLKGRPLRELLGLSPTWPDTPA